MWTQSSRIQTARLSSMPRVPTMRAASGGQRRLAISRFVSLWCSKTLQRLRRCGKRAHAALSQICFSNTMSTVSHKTVYMSLIKESTRDFLTFNISSSATALTQLETSLIQIRASLKQVQSSAALSCFCGAHLVLSCLAGSGLPDAPPSARGIRSRHCRDDS